jgi:hypothetical protein
VRPLVTQIGGTDSSSTSDYHALQTSVRRRFGQGLEFLASYTLSKTLTDNRGYYGAGANNPVAGWSAYWIDAYNRSGDRALSFFDARHSFVVSGTYDLPFGRRRVWGNNWGRAANVILGGWNVSSIVSLHSGFPVTILASAAQSLQGSRAGERPNRVAGQTGKVENPTPDNWLSDVAYNLPMLGKIGNAGNSTERAPGFANWDFAIGKEFQVTERKSFDLRVEIFNFTNHPSYGPPGNNISAPNAFGVITNTVNDPRILEIALKFHF